MLTTAALLMAAAPVATAPLAYVPIIQPPGVQVINLDTNAVVTTIPLTDNPSQLAIAPDGKLAYATQNRTSSGQLGDTLAIIATETNSVRGSITVGQQPEAIAIAPNGQFVYVANANWNSVSVIAAANNTVVATIIVGRGPAGLAFSPDGSFLYVADVLAGTVTIVDPGSNAVLYTVPVGSVSGDLVVSPDGAFLYVADRINGGISVIDTASRTVVNTIKTGANTHGTAVTPDGRSVYAVSGTYAEGFSLSVIDAASATVIANIPLDASAPCGQLSVSPDGAFVYVTNAGSKITVIATATNAVVKTISTGTTSGRLEFAPARGQDLSLSALKLDHSKISGGTLATATIVLTAAAPSGGAGIELSSNSASAVLPASVTVAAGSRIANVTITTQPVASLTQVILTATWNNASKEASVTVTPVTGISISNVTVDPSTLIAGSPAKGTVTLTGAAPAGGLPIELWSNGVAVFVPSGLIIPQGATYATFPLTTTSASGTVYGTISAFYNGEKRSTVLTINPILSLASLSVNTPLVGGTSATGTVTLNAAAPPGGITVDLWTEGAPAFVPSNVSVRAGTTTGTFTITTGYTAKAVQRNVTAFYNGVKKEAMLTVTPALGVDSVSLSPTTVVAGTWAVGSLTLTTPAPEKGIVVALWTSGWPAFVPSSIAIPAGSSSATFPVVTVPAFSLVQCKVTAFYNGSSSTTTFAVTPWTYGAAPVPVIGPVK